MRGWTPGPSCPYRIFSVNRSLFPDMKPRNLPIWEHFIESTKPENSNGPIVLCQITGCPQEEVKRGAPDVPRGKLNSTSMEFHLQKFYLAKYKEFEEKKLKQKTEARKRKLSAEEENFLVFRG